MIKWSVSCLFDKLALIDKVIFIGFGLIIILFILSIIIYRIKYEWQRENLSEYFNELKEKDFDDE